MTRFPTLLPGAEPFFFPGDSARAGARIGCLCLHGLNASPQEVYWLGRSLAAQGAMVYGARLYGHGIDVALLNRARWQDWVASALDGYHLLKQNCDRVYILGLSMGGLCALLLASECDIAGVIPMAAALRVRGNLRPTHLLRYTGVTVIPYNPAQDTINQRVQHIQQQAGEPITGRVSYFAQKATGLSELLRMQAAALGRLDRITAPALLIYSERDSLVPFGVMAELQGHLKRAAAVETLRLTSSDHILTNDVEMDQVFAAAWDFIQRHP